MPLPLYYAVRITTHDGANVMRRILRVGSVEQLCDATHNKAQEGTKVETKYLGSGEPIFRATGPRVRAFHTEEQLRSYNRGLMGHALYSEERFPLDDMGYLGEIDAREAWDVACTFEEVVE